MYLCVAVITGLKIATDTVAKAAKNSGLVCSLIMHTGTHWYTWAIFSNSLKKGTLKMKPYCIERSFS